MDGAHIRNKAIYLAIGINLAGTKEVLGLRVAQTEGAKFWLQIVTQLKNRGVEDIFNAIEWVNMSLRKIIKNRGWFPTDEAALKLLYPALQNISRKWRMPIKQWKAALNGFAILFEDRMPAL